MKLTSNSTIVQFLKYGVVGGIAFVVDYGSLFCLTEFAGVHHLVSAAVAFVLGLLVNYILSLKFVFTESRLDTWWKEFAIFSLIGVVGLLFNELIIYVITDLLGFHYMIGKLVSTAIVFLWNFFARKYILFTKD